jgi:hypothetical protein
VSSRGGNGRNYARYGARPFRAERASNHGEELSVRGRGRRAFVVSACFALVFASAACGGGSNAHSLNVGGATSTTLCGGTSARNLSGGSTTSTTGNGCGEGGGSSSSSNGQASAPAGEVSFSIDGSITDHEKSVYNNTHGVVETYTSWSWTATLSATIDEINQGTAIPKLTDVTGSGWWKGYGAGPAMSCTYHLSAPSNLAQSQLQQLLSVQPPGAINSPSATDYVVSAVPPTVVSDNTNPHESQCNTGPAGGYWEPPQDTTLDEQFRKAAFPTVHFHPDGSSTDASNTFKYNGSEPNSPPDETVTVDETVSTHINWGA